MAKQSAALKSSLLGSEKNSGTGQSSHSPSIDICSACVLNAGTTAFEARSLDTATVAVTGTISNVLPDTVVFFTAYSISSAYSSDGLCVTTSGSAVTMSPELSITKPATADPTAFSSSVTALFASFLGFLSCSNGGAGQVNVIDTMAFPNATSTTTSETGLVQVKNATATPLTLLSATSGISSTSVSPAPNSISSSFTTSSAAKDISSGFTTKDKVATGVVVSVVAIITILLSMMYLRRRRKQNKSRKDTNNSADASGETQPYLQQKAELEAEEKRRLELEAVEVRYEMDGADNITEMPGNDIRNEIDTAAEPEMSSLRKKHELRGEEFSKELEAPQSHKRSSSHSSLQTNAMTELVNSRG